MYGKLSSTSILTAVATRPTTDWFRKDHMPQGMSEAVSEGIFGAT